MCRLREMVATGSSSLIHLSCAPKGSGVLPFYFQILIERGPSVGIRQDLCVDLFSKAVLFASKRLNGYHQIDETAWENTAGARGSTRDRPRSQSKRQYIRVLNSIELQLNCWANQPLGFEDRLNRLQLCRAPVSSFVLHLVHFTSGPTFVQSGPQRKHFILCHTVLLVGHSIQNEV